MSDANSAGRKTAVNEGNAPTTEARPAWRPPQKNTLVERYLHLLECWDQLPDSQQVPVGACCAHDSVSLATGWRRIQEGKWPAARYGKLVLGEFRRATAAAA
jgi:hypothetical protein